MEHEDAIRMNAVEGYLLDHLNDAERDAFEEHYADCEACFEDVQTGARFTKTIAEIDPIIEPRRNFTFAFAAAASVVLSIAAIGYQQVAVVAPLRARLAEESQPRMMPLVDLRETRGEEQPVTFERNDRPVVILTMGSDLADSAPYTCKIVDAQRKVQGKPVTIPAEEAVNFDVGRRAPGNYTLIVSGSHGVPVLEKRFTVR